MTLPRSVVSELWLLLLLGCQATSGCRGCDKGEPRRSISERSPHEESTEPAAVETCQGPADCADDEVCTKEDCVDGRCVTSFVATGTSCDNETVCDGVATCDEGGHCVPGIAPLLDDGNACTTDTCDPARGVLHQSVPIDDSNACTNDACETETGEITHSPVDLDDGDDCTTDSCEPRAGIRHEPRSPTYTCSLSCGPGFHVTSRTEALDCVASTRLRSVCMPDCGATFYTCDNGCPNGYRVVSKTANSQCGTAASTYTFCQKDRVASAAGAPGELPSQN